MRLLCRKATVENPKEDTNTMTLREENPQTNKNDIEDMDVLKEIASHSCFMISKRDKTKRSKERGT